MNPLSWPVVIGTLLIASPALWAAQVSGTLSTDVAFTRLLVCLAVVWAGCSVVSHYARSAVAANEAAERAVRVAAERAERAAAREEAERNAAEADAQGLGADGVGRVETADV